MISFYQRNVEPGEILFADDFSKPEEFDKNWFTDKGEWWIKNGELYGMYRGNNGGLLYTRKEFPGDVMLDYYGTMIGPCDNDLNFLFRTNGRLDENGHYDGNNQLKGYVGGLNGWWLNHAGIEREPGCPLALVVNFKAEADREYHIQTGINGTTLFLAVDGELVFALEDPTPMDQPGCHHVGLGTYCSQIKVRDFKVCRPAVTQVERSYTPDF